MKDRFLPKSLVALAILVGACSSATRSGGSGGAASKGGSTTSGGVASGGNNGTGGIASSGGSSSTGGASISGNGGAGSGGAGGGTTCTNGAACGGDVTGSWSVSSSCLAVSGQMNMGPLGLGCTSAPVTGSLQVSGTWTAKSDGTYSDNTVTTGSEQLTLPASCLLISGTTTTCAAISALFGGYFDTTVCKDATGGGCTCQATVKQSGWAGWLSTNASANGNLKTASNVLTIDDEAQYSYCVSGNKMTWSLKPADKGATLTGSVVLQSGSAPGNGGSAAGGAGGKGGGSGGVAGAGGAVGSGGASSGGATGTGGTVSPSTGPCDIYAAASPPTPCVGAYSMSRVLYSKYTGPLYQVRKGGTWDKTTGPSGGTTLDISAVGSYANVTAQDDFCSGATCTVSILYDQSGKKNDLKAGPAGCYKGGDGAAAEADKESSATKRQTTLAGHKVYALQMVAHDGYRNNKTTGMATGTAAQGIYMLADGRKVGTSCCWDFGNAMPTNCADGTGSMDALMLGSGGFGKGAGSPPWFMGDFEFGVWACGSQQSSQACTNPDLPSMSSTEFAFGILKTSMSGSTGQYCIRTADGVSASLKTAYDGAAPQPWHLGGAIILGVGGDNSNWSYGTFFEGAITAGRPSDATDALVLANVQAAKYGQ